MNTCNSHCNSDGDGDTLLLVILSFFYNTSQFLFMSHYFIPCIRSYSYHMRDNLLSHAAFGILLQSLFLSQSRYAYPHGIAVSNNPSRTFINFAMFFCISSTLAYNMQKLLNFFFFYTVKHLFEVYKNYLCCI